METVRGFILGGSKLTADGDCSHEIKRCLLLGRKAMANLDSIFKSRDITLPTKIHLVKAMVSPIVMYGCESWTLLFSMLSRLAIAFLSRNKHLLISWLQKPSAVILEPRKIKSATVSTVSSSICHEVMGPDAMILVLSQIFHSTLSVTSRDSSFSSPSTTKGGVICLSEGIDISPSNLECSLCFIQSGISHDVLCI